MLKARNKKVSIILILAMMMTMFIGLGTASAASSYSALNTQNVKDINTPFIDGVIQVDVTNVAALKAGGVLSIHLPSALDMTTLPKLVVQDEAANAGAGTLKYYDATGTMVNYPGPATAPSVLIDVPATLVNGTDANGLADNANFTAVPLDANTIDLIYNGSGSGVGLFYIKLQHLTFNDTIDGAITVNMLSPSSSGWTSGAVTVGNFTTGGGATMVIAKSVTTMRDTALTPMDTIMFQETAAGTLVNNDTIKFKVPNGFEWDTANVKVDADWGFASTMSSTLGAATYPTIGLADSGRTLEVTYNGTASSTEGRLYINGAKLQVTDDSVAKYGDVVMSVSGDDVTDQDVTIADYETYALTVASVTSPTVVAGWNDTEIGSFEITEGVANSLIPGRSVTLTLPSGVKWYNTAADNDWPFTGSAKPFSTTYNKGDATLGAPSGTTNSGRTITLTVGDSDHSKTDVILKKLDVTIDPSFTGDINLTVAGSAGASGSINVGTVVAPVTIANDGKSEVQIGAQAQAISDVTITENAAAALQTGGAAGNDDVILALPDGATFTSKPTVTVTAGDAVIDSTDLTNSDNQLKITMKGESSTASTLTVSGIQVTANRSLPEGDFKLTLKADNDSGEIISGALTDNAADYAFNVSDITSAVIAQVVTPAESNSASCQFKIDSNIYEVNGLAKVMDVAPYIKNSRTYVPLRYLGLGLGVADSDVVWDATAQTATLTLGSTVVVFTIGSTTYTVNGVATTMDVAPEINNGRTMLPARYVAEGLGYLVGWDASTRTVLVSK
jgi:hypothetical protein